jgi:hypothetical protein
MVTATQLQDTHDAKMHKYSPLDSDQKEIRLLILQPGSSDSILCCTLEQAFLDTWPPPAYETISYVCGDQTIRATINLDGSEVRVPATSEAALRRMQLESRPRTLWIDSICINENDVDERGHQVGMMFEIYTRTFHNLIYLGPDRCDIPLFIASMGDLLHEISIETRGYADFVKMLDESWGKRDEPDVPFSIDIKQSGLVEFFENSWFSRLWIVQEASLSPMSTCYTSRHHFALAPVLRIAEWLNHKWFQMPDLTPAQVRGIMNAVSIFDSADRTYGILYRRQNTLWDFLDTFNQFLTFDPRDQVFALVGLWQMHTRASALPALLKPDYKISVPVVWTNASKFAIQETNDLWSLRDVCVFGREDDWPSWVPVIDRQLKSNMKWLELARSFRADAESPMRLYNLDDGSGTLEVLGFLIDEVSNVISTPEPFTASAASAFMASAEDVRFTSAWVENLGHDLATRAGIVLAGGIKFGNERATDEQALQGYESFKRYLKNHNSCPLREKELEPRASDEERAAGRYFESLKYAATCRAVFHTKDGHLGLGPEVTQPGDIVAILYGCQWPVVMRPLAIPGEYIFLECAYVYGIMDGEAVRRHNELGREDDRFRII